MTATPEQLARRWIRKNIRALQAYHVPDPGDMIKLDAMENPYQWPEAMQQAWLQELAGQALNRYPDPSAAVLTRALRESFGIPETVDVLLGNGSDELIQIMAMAVAGPGRAILAPEPGFVMYRMIAEFTGMDYVAVPLQADDFSLDMEAMRNAIDEHDPAIIFLAYPNNPTGNLFDEQQVREIIEQGNGLVVVDEAYAAFASHSFLPMLTEYDNLLVMRTVSKMGLAGLRLGFLMGTPALVREFDKIRLPYNINVLTQSSATYALAHRDVLDAQTSLIREQRQQLFDDLSVMDGIVVYPSEANFLLLRTAKGQAGRIFEGLKQKGVLIKNLDPAGGMLQDCLRVTVGRPEENAAFVTALSELL